MFRRLGLLAAVGCLLLGGCASGGGGGPTGGGTSVTPPPPPPPPPPANTSFSDLPNSQGFAHDASMLMAKIGVSPGVVQDTSAGNNILTVNYDATSRNYSVSYSGNPGGVDIFTPADLQSPSGAGFPLYAKSSGSVRSSLTLIDHSPNSGKTFSYVRAGLHQRDEQNGSVQNTLYQPFTFGFPTSSASLPRNGTAGYDAEIHGLVTMNGAAPRNVNGTGEFSADFLSAGYLFQGSVSETDPTTGAALDGGTLRTGGTFTSDGAFSGQAAYSNGLGGWSGAISGRLYGPAGVEIGATFALLGPADHTNFVGSVIGAKNTTGVTENPTLDRLLVTEEFATQVAPVTSNTSIRTRSLTLNTDGSAVYSSWNNQNVTFRPADKIASPDPNLIAYRQSGVLNLSLYVPGSGNSELPLTYASFGSWQASHQMPDQPVEFFTFGIPTPQYGLLRKTGAAAYSGVVRGAAFVAQGSNSYELSGAASFDVDFTHSTYTGGLSIKGKDINGGLRDFGAFDFDGSVGNATLNVDGELVSLKQNGALVGAMSNRFFGPDGQEIGGVFNMTVGGGAGPPEAVLSGVALAKRNN